MPALSTELIGLRLWQDDARERIANDAAHIAAQDALLLEQNAALTACSEALHRAWTAHPLLTLGVMARIHWQALQLWWRRVPFFHKPVPPAALVSR